MLHRFISPNVLRTEPTSGPAPAPQNAPFPARLRRERPVQQQSLARQMRRLRAGDHAGAFVRGPDEAAQALAAFVTEARRQGAWPVYVQDELTIAEVTDSVSVSGIALGPEVHGVRLLTKHDWRGYGAVKPERWLAHIRGILQGYLTAGAPSLWLAVEMTWALDPDINAEELSKLDAALAAFLVNTPVSMLCLYDQERFSEAFLHEQVRTHPFIVHSGRLSPNPYMEAGDDGVALESMLADLQGQRSFRRRPRARALV